MQALGIHHVGIAVADLDAAIETYRRLLGAELEHRQEIGEQGVEAAAVRVGDARLELVAPLAADTYVGRFLDRRGPGMHHVAIEVDDVRAALGHLTREGASLVDPEPRRGLFGLEVAFVHPESLGGVLAEVVGRG